MDYKEARLYINQLNKKGIHLGLERMAALMEALGHPERTLRCIHVAGTNGKGSVCAFLDSVLRKAGLRVGRYISPTIYDYRERIQINGEWIEKESLARILTNLKQVCNQLVRQGVEMPTVFEIETAMAFCYFQEKQCDYVLLEVGMGGRLDSTNIIDRPILSIITSVSLDHVQLLGKTISAIAKEKAGILKIGCPAVLGVQSAEAMKELKQQCERKGISPVEVDEKALYAESWELQKQSFSYKTWSKITIRLVGDYQRKNAAVALEALHLLQQYEPRLTEERIRQGMACAEWPGRFMVVCEEPLVIIDGAHNSEGAQALAESLQHLQRKKCWLLMGVFRDKDYIEIAKIMRSCGDTIYCFTPEAERGLASEQLAEAITPYYSSVIDAKTAEQAVASVWERAAKEDIIVSFGSLSTVQAVRQAIKQRRTADEAYRSNFEK